MFVELAPLLLDDEATVVMSLARVVGKPDHLRLTLYPHPEHRDSVKLEPICLEATPAELDAPGIDFSPAAELHGSVNEQIKKSAAASAASSTKKGGTKAIPAKTGTAAKATPKTGTPAAAAPKPTAPTAAEKAAKAAADKKAKEDAEAAKKAEAEKKVKDEKEKKRLAEIEKLRVQLAKLQGGTAAPAAPATAELPLAAAPEGGS
jgi:colicin import membrane protein